MKKHIEIKTIEHNGVDVTVRIDYDRGTASLVDLNKYDSTWEGRYSSVKDWRFGHRTIEHMDGWVKILEAMIFAVKECKKDLQVKVDEDNQKRIKLLDMMIYEGEETKKGLSKKRK